MNNSHILPGTASLLVRDNKHIQEKVQEREASLVKQIAAIRDICESLSWSTLKTEVFDPLLTSLKRDLEEEAKKQDPNSNKLNRISGEIKWAERFSDLEKFESSLLVELQYIKTRLHENQER